MVEVTFTTVSWTAGDYLTEAKMDLMVANDRAVDAMAQGILFSERAAPSTPAVNKLHLYAKDKSGVSTLYYKKDDGVVVEIGAAEGGFDSGFSVHLNSNQTITQNTDTKVQFDTESYDLGGEFDPTTNFRFTATNAGKYLFTFTADLSSLADGKNFLLKIYKNGAQVNYVVAHSSGASVIVPNMTVILNLAANDYVEFYVHHNDTVSRILNGAVHRTYVMGQRLR